MSGTGPRTDLTGPGLPPVEVPQTSRDRWRRRLRGKRAIAVYALSAAVIAAAVVIPIATAPPPPKPKAAPCHGGLVAVPDSGRVDCVGLTDGSQVFDPRLAGVEGLIRAENDGVTASGKPWVAVAYLVPMTLNQGSAITLEGVHEELQGAYVAQWEANHTHAYGDLPMLKLYLVNEGPDQGSWPTAVAQILAATRDGRGVVAVAGLGDSVDATRAAAKVLSGAQLAMFGTAITADNLNGARYTSLVRVAPTNLDEVKAALAFLPALPSRGTTAMLVADTNVADDYTRTWASGVQSLYPVGGRRFVVPAPETFDRTLLAEGDRFVQIAGAVCQRQPRVVFFAGRAKDLEMFIGALGARGCGNPVTVISGDDDLIDAGTTTAADYSDYLHALSTGNITLYSTALAHPDEWTPAICGPTPPSQADAARTFSQFTKDYARLLGRLALPLNLGNAMLARDAVITAVMTIRGPVRQTAAAQQPYRYQEVTQNLSGLHDTPIPGASGVITISNYGPSNGDPIGKPLAIVEHTHTGSVTCKRVEIP